MQETRKQILEYLRRNGSAAVHDLAEHLQISIGTVRHHLNVLQRDNMVESKEIRHGVGRPRLVYALSSTGLEAFPKKYDWLSSALLSELKQRFDPATVSSVLRGIAQQVLDKYQPELEATTLEERAHILVEIMGQEGFETRLEKTEDNRIRIVQNSCPYRSVVQNHNEVCQLDAEMIHQVLQQPIQRKCCMLHGDHSCVFEAIPLNSKAVPIDQTISFVEAPAPAEHVK
jgi:predicted ArsR family transcriptional regulator